MKNRFLLLLCFVSPAAAMASYEMALIADSGRIHRYDPEANVYLGSFGRFGGNLLDMATDQTTGKTFVSDSSGFLSRYNYSTGTSELGINTTTARSLNIVNNEVWLQNGPTITRYNQNLSSLGTVTLATSDLVSSMHLLNGKLFTLETSGTNAIFRRYSMTGSLESTLITFSNVNSVLGHIGSVRFLDGTSTDLLLAGLTISGTQRAAFVSLNGLAVTGFSAYIPGMITGFRDFAPTHTGGIYLGLNASNTSQGAFSVSSANALLDGPYGTAQLVSPQAVNVIVAPEPGSMLAFGLGGWLLLRRKR